MGRRSNIDWEQIDREIRLGHKTLAQICRDHSIARSTLNRRLSETGIERDLTPIVKAATNAAITKERAEKAKELSDKAPEIGREIGKAIAQASDSGIEGDIAIVAALGAARNRVHADVAAKIIEAGASMVDEVMALNNADFREAVSALLLDGAGEEPEERAAVGRAIDKLFSLPDRARTLDTLAAAANKGIAIDRKANKLDEPEAKEAGSIDDYYKQVDELVRAKKAKGE